MARTPLMAGNWKMNCTHVEAVGLVQKLAWTLADKRHDPERSEVVVLPPFTDLRTVQTLVDGDKLKIGYGAQDVSANDDGAYTGEVSVGMLAKLKCRYVTVGHSERRFYHHEDDALVNAKARKALSGGITPIICVGEGLDIRQSGEHVPYTLAQVSAALSEVSAEQAASLVIAYEPVWAIGSGEVASPENAEEVCGAIRHKVADLYSDEVAATLRVLYGGSVNPDNVRSLMDRPELDGCLVGGASLVPDDFAAIARFYDLPAL